MLPPWSATIDGLYSNIRSAFQSRDSWLLLTVLGVDESSAECAEREVAVIAQYEGDLDGLNVTDLGCGAGRHLRAFSAFGAKVTGVDSSRRLGQLARHAAPGARIEVADMRELHGGADQDIVTLMSDNLTLGSTRRGLEALLRVARSHLRDNGLLVAVLGGPTAAGCRKWSPRCGLSATETISIREAAGEPALLQRRFDFDLDGARYEFKESSLLLNVQDIALLARKASLRLEHTQKLGGDLGRDYDGDRILFFRAEPGFNYLSDLTDFLESWLVPEHRRNHRPSRTRLIEGGRLTLDETTAPGRGDSLSRHHPAFYDCIEPGIRALVRRLVNDWNQISYSSCEGHLIPHRSRETYTEAYVGLVTLDDRHTQLAQTLFRSIASLAGSQDIDCQVSLGDLLGPIGKVAAVNLHIRRRGHIRWQDYEAARNTAVNRLVAALQRNGGGGP